MCLLNFTAVFVMFVRDTQQKFSSILSGTWSCKITCEALQIQSQLYTSEGHKLVASGRGVFSCLCMHLMHIIKNCVKVWPIKIFTVCLHLNSGQSKYKLLSIGCDIKSSRKLQTFRKNLLCPSSA